ncbi:hypothetical protein Hokovirus_3_158 [Hokovirus HKV1]|uniref:Uncharacterized protein n=1 Tax=Hokovirus HKV1 TaxID=1977638 RepID=A0A1V0SGN7_9VIRU|nr:hypothetical protein Hokovirus_3_158 [Hokovirus HKV1]
MQEYNEQTPILQAKIKYVTELNINTIKNNSDKQKQVTIDNINNQRKEVIQNINNELKIYKEKILLIRNLIAKDYVDNNYIVYDNKYGDYENFIKYTNKVNNCIKRGVIIDENNNWLIKLWNYKNNYNYDNLFNNKNEKYNLIKYYNVEPKKKQFFINNLYISESQEVSLTKLFVITIMMLIMCTILPILLLISELNIYIASIVILIYLFLCIFIPFCLVCVGLRFIIVYITVSPFWKQYYEYEKKREKYYNIIGKNNMELLIELNDQYNKLINTNNLNTY